MFGRKEAGGRVQQVNTFSQFDSEVSKAYLTDKFYIVRKAALFNCKVAWNHWLGYSRFGSSRKSSAEAEAQGGRQEDPMCINFFMGKQPGNENKVLMRYKFREDDRHWAPYLNEGIPCLSSSAPDNLQDLLRHPGIRAPKAWPEKEAIRKYLLTSNKLRADEKEEWRRFFLRVPESVEDFTESQLFEWKLPRLVEDFIEAKRGPQGQIAGIGDTDRPEQPDERVLWSGFTAAEARQQAKTRADNYQREKHALAAKEKSDAVTKRRRRTRGGRRISQDTTQETNADNEDNDVMAAGDMGVVAVGDVVMISPDKESRDRDIANGYKLGLNIAQVRSLNHDEGLVELWWYFSNSNSWTTKAKFFPWRENKTNEMYKDWLPVHALIQDTWGTLVKLDLTWVSGREGYASYVLTKESVKTIEEIIRQEEDDDAN
jgi:hypothetical protein